MRASDGADAGRKKNNNHNEQEQQQEKKTNENLQTNVAWL